MENCWILSANGKKRMCPTTKGWRLLVRWKDGTSSWIALKDLKDSNPIETSKYAGANGVSEQPVFAWWAKLILSKRQLILSKLNKTKYFHTTEKFGIKMPRTVHIQRTLRAMDHMHDQHHPAAIQATTTTPGSMDNRTNNHPTLQNGGRQTPRPTTRWILAPA